MNAQLAALLVFIGYYQGAPGVEVYIPGPGVTRAQIITACAGQCVRKDVTLEIPPELSTDGGYQRKRIDVVRAPLSDGGVAVGIKAAYASVPLVSQWVSTTLPSTLAVEGEADEPWDCACRSGTVNCLAVDAGGGAVTDGGCTTLYDVTCLQTSDGGPAVGGSTLAAGSWSGAGCVRKQCVEYFGRPGVWPASCPGGP